jgi:hypothetical protein
LPVPARRPSPVNDEEDAMLDWHDPRGPARPSANPDRPFPVRYAVCYTRLAGFHPPDRRAWREATCTDLFANGAILLLDEELAPNSILTLLLPGGAPGPGLSRLTRLVGTAPSPEGGWLAACEFPLLLGAGDFAKLRAAGVAARPPAEAGLSAPHAPLGRCGKQDPPRHRESTLSARPGGRAEGPRH